MKLFTFGVLIFCTSAVVWGENWTTVDGETYQDVEVVRHDAARILIKHKTGMSRIYFSKLPEKIQKRFSYNSQRARHLLTAEHDARIKEQRRRAVSEWLKNNSVCVRGKILQVLKEGILVQNLGVNFSYYKEEGLYYKRKVATGEPRPIYRKSEGLISNSPKLTGWSQSSKTVWRWKGEVGDWVQKFGHEKIAFVYCNSSDLVDDEEWSDIILPATSYSYTTITGAIKTVPAFTTSASHALKVRNE